MLPAMKYAALLLLLLQFAGCASSRAPGEISRPIGLLRLESPVTIPADWATVRLQYGQVVAFNAVQEWDPFCVLEHRDVAPTPRPMESAEIQIVAVNRSVETFSGMPVLPAVDGQFGLGDGGHGDGPSQVYFKTRFLLADNPQRLLHLTCMSNQAMPGVAIMRHLSLEDMAQALGQRMTLKLHGR